VAAPPLLPLGGAILVFLPMNIKIKLQISINKRPGITYPQYKIQWDNMCICQSFACVCHAGYGRPHHLVKLIHVRPLPDVSSRLDRH